MSDNEACKDCRAHGRLDQRVEHLEKENETQWREIDSMRKWWIATLTSSILSLLGVIVILLI